MVWKIVRYSLLLILVAFTALAGYGWLDCASALDDARSEQKYELEGSELLRDFATTFNHGAKRSEIMQCVTNNFGKSHIIKEEQDRVLVDDIVFRFDKTQSLADVHFLGSEEGD